METEKKGRRANAQEDGLTRLRQMARGRIDLLCAMLFAGAAFYLAGNARAVLPYIDIRLLTLLFCLMIVTGGLRACGVIERFCFLFLRRCRTARAAAAFFVWAAFFSSMVITNDAALLVFVPETILILWRNGMKDWILPTVVWETIGANLGSMLLPMGNPQNLFLYFHYHMEPGPFLAVTAPYTAAAFLLLGAAFFSRKNRPVPVTMEARPVRQGEAAVLCAIFAGILLAVLRLVPWQWVLLPAGAALLWRPGLWKGADWHLLGLFAFLFVGVGNLQHVPALSEGIVSMVKGEELAAAILLSQVISNVPAAVLLAGYTEDAAALAAGTNIGGLGTLIASMASLISFRLYGKVPGASVWTYTAVFTFWNGLFLLALWGIACILL